MSGPTYTRRQAFAQLLLFGDPIGMEIFVDGAGRTMLWVQVEDLAELARWKRAFLGDNLTYEDLLDDAKPGQLLAFADGSWAGWPLRLTVRAPEREDDVDELAAGGIREKLQQLVDEPGDVGKCPQCGKQARSYSRGCSQCGYGEPGDGAL